MSRTLWFAAGAGASVYVMVRARRLKEAVTIDGLRDRAGAAVVGLRAFREEVAQGQAEKERELRERLHLVPPGHGQLAAPGGVESVSSQTSSAPEEGNRTARPAEGKHKRKGTA